jgi:hypothetical protein
MIYFFDKKELTYKNVTKKLITYSVIGCILSTLVLSSLMLYIFNDVKYITEETKLSILKEKNEFSSEKLKNALVSLNVKFPHIVYAQAKLETGNFTSKIFKENNNLFGMREARVRPTTNKGTENNHAYFDTWYDSVLDYAFYQASYLSDIKTESEYFQYLSQNYAEAPNYIEVLQKTINAEKF